ncbi:MAG: hypothetical protein FP816_05480 [Desulfobacteraceae bacterium]|nr:hypothetical protein [Desulfobacteraceae bacterium]
MKLRDAKILTDENVSPKVVKFLRDIGLDVLDVKEQNLHGSEDETLLAMALKEQRIIMSHDSDFGTLAINQGKKFHGIIFLRLKSPKPDNAINALNQLFAGDLELQPATILVLEEGRVRIRRPLLE